MRYIMKAGILYNDDALAVLARVKSSLVGPLKKIDDNKGQLLLEADIRCLDQIKSSSGDVRNREYVLIDPEGKVVASARPGYAKGDEPDVVGWPICRMPRVDNAKLNINGTEYFLAMHNSQNYAVTDNKNLEVLRIMHKGIAGGWVVEDDGRFAPEILCGIFVFCRYIEHENEFLIV